MKCLKNDSLRLATHHEESTMTPEYIARIDTSGRGRYDVTPLFADARAFAALVDDLLAFAQPLSFEIVAGIDALGFILGSALAIRSWDRLHPDPQGGQASCPHRPRGVRRLHGNAESAGTAPRCRASQTACPCRR